MQGFCVCRDCQLFSLPFSPPRVAGIQPIRITLKLLPQRSSRQDKGNRSAASIPIHTTPSLIAISLPFHPPPLPSVAATASLQVGLLFKNSALFVLVSARWHRYIPTSSQQLSNNHPHKTSQHLVRSYDACIEDTQQPHSCARTVHNQYIISTSPSAEPRSFGGSS